MPKHASSHNSSHTPKQAKVKKVMSEFRDGKLKSKDGQKVTEFRQALAIAMSEADNLKKDK